MITFKDIIETNKQLGKTQELINSIQKTESAYRYETGLNSKLMEQLNKLVGKYFTEKTKAYVHDYYDEKNKIKSATLQISKAGIGKTGQYNTNITPFRELITSDGREGYYNSDGLIDTVIADKEVFYKCISHMSTNGKYILNTLKEVYEHHKINDPDSSKVVTKFKALPDEIEIFGQENLFIHINDNNNVRLEISKKKENDRYSNNETIFELNSLDIEDEKDFMYNLFVNNHVEEITKAIKDYKEITTERLNTWKNFNEELNEKLAKFLILMNM